MLEHLVSNRSDASRGTDSFVGQQQHGGGVMVV